MASYSESDNVPSGHVTFIKYMGIWATVLGFILTLMGCIPGSPVSSVLIYAGVTLLMCGTFFWLAFRSLSKYEILRQTLPGEETLTDEGRDSRHTERASVTSLHTNIDNVYKYIQLSNQTGNFLIIKIQRSGLTSFEMIHPNQLDPAILSASSLTSLEASFCNSHQVQAEVIINLIAVLRRSCSNVQFQNGRSYVYDDGTASIHLWPLEKRDCPPKYTEVCDDTDLPSYSDVIFVDMETVDSRLYFI